MSGCDHTHDNFQHDSQAGVSRRAFLSGSAVVAGAALAGGRLVQPVHVAAAALPAVPSMPALAARSTVAITKGSDRRANITGALNMIRDEIVRDIGDRQVVIKPNMVRIEAKLALGMSHPDALRGVLDFLKPIYKKEVIIAENCGVGPGDTAQGYQVLGFSPLPGEYKCRLADLAEFGVMPVQILDAEFRPRTVKMARIVTDPNTYVISLGIPKVHLLAGVTLSVKNMAMGSVVDGRVEKVKMHPQVDIPGFREKRPRDPNFNKMFHYNLFRMASFARPSLAILDGWEGMERQGPTGGDAVPLHAAIVGTDFIAVDRVAMEIMDIPFHTIGCQHYCAEAQLGHGDMEQIAVVGERIAAVKRPFVRIANHDELIVW